MNIYKILKKVLQSKQNWLQNILGGFGFGLGLIFVLLALQFYIAINHFFEEQKKGKNDFLIISKPISLANTIFGANTGFGKQEIENLKSQNFIEDVASFTANQFSVVASAERIGFYTEMFFEALPDKFIDNKPSTFEWQEGNEFVPILLSQDMLDLYNFGFAISKGGQLPQLTSSTIGLVSFGLRLKGNKAEKRFRAKIVGFSQRYATILVPQNFMQWANENIGDNENKNPSRVVLKLKQENGHRAADFLENKGYQINKDKLLATQTAGIVLKVMSAVALLGVFFVILAIVVFSMSMRLILAESKTEIQLLLQIGYKPQQILSFLMQNFGKNIVILGILSFLGVYFLNQMIHQYLQNTGLTLSNYLQIEVIILNIFLLLSTLFLQFFWLNQWINQMKK